MTNVVDDFVNLYKSGVSFDYIPEKIGVSDEQLKDIIKYVKKNEKESGSYNSEFKMIVVMRICNGISKLTVSKELGISNNTVVKFCRETSMIKSEPVQVVEKLYTDLNVKHVSGECPLCKSKRFNNVGVNNYYCVSCGNEFKIVGKDVKKLNFEFL